MLKLFQLAAVAFIAGTTIALTTASVWAFSQQILTPNGSYDFNYGSLDDKSKSGESAKQSDPNSPGFHFSIGPGQTGPFGFRSFRDDDKSKPPDFSRPLGNGD
jgi:hypothetical protein